ncbi:hypothetical protein TcasGA2_TC031378 [Tribolium castaneum]|uniref:Uncharacterized protein n=1 Tax=Tribolium castaneum TaxID=7070 RepID=A0A139WB04_TRICA|nr:hypothetical protein TcasGA2_TC031378 [Tribolium castaneum]
MDVLPQNFCVFFNIIQQSKKLFQDFWKIIIFPMKFEFCYKCVKTNVKYEDVFF